MSDLSTVRPPCPPSRKSLRASWDRALSTLSTVSTLFQTLPLLHARTYARAHAYIFSFQPWTGWTGWTESHSRPRKPVHRSDQRWTDGGHPLVLKRFRVSADSECLSTPEILAGGPQ